MRRTPGLARLPAGPPGTPAVVIPFPVAVSHEYQPGAGAADIGNDAGPGVAGLLLAAGAGRRMGLAKALVRDADGTAWVTRSARVLADGGCRPVLVVVGSVADQVIGLVPETAHPVLAVNWAEGMGASLRAGLVELAVDPSGVARKGTVPMVAVLIGLVDTPGVSSAVVARMLAAAGPEALARATYHGRPGHPVLIGRDHWAGAAAAARGDAGARGYLAGRDDVRMIECADVGDGEDYDHVVPRSTP